MTKCNICDSDCSKQSYFLRVDKELWEVCPECHHYYTYGTKEQLKNYKERRGIKI